MKLIDLTGEMFGRLLVLKRAPDYIQENGRHRVMWECECQCNNHTIVTVNGEKLRYGKTKSCGCLAKEMHYKTHKKYNKYDLSGEYGIG